MTSHEIATAPRTWSELPRPRDGRTEFSWLIAREIQGNLHHSMKGNTP